MAQVSTVRAADDDAFGGGSCQIKLNEEDDGGAQGSGGSDCRAEETNAAEAAGRDGYAGWRLPLHASPAVPTWNRGRITYENFGFKGKYLPIAWRYITSRRRCILRAPD